MDDTKYINERWDDILRERAALHRTDGGIMLGGRRKRGRARARARGRGEGECPTCGGEGILLGGYKKKRKQIRKVRRGRGEEEEEYRRIGGVKGKSAWITFVKKYAKKHDITYKEALMEAGPLYRKCMRM